MTREWWYVIACAALTIIAVTAVLFADWYYTTTPEQPVCYWPFKAQEIGRAQWPPQLPPGGCQLPPQLPPEVYST